MNLRVVAGRELVDKDQRPATLVELARTADLVVQGDEHVVLITQAERPAAFVAGRVFGWRSNTGRMRAVEDVQLEIASALHRNTMDECVDALEGRFVFARLLEDGSFEISCDKFGQADLYYQKVGRGVLFATDMSLLPVAQHPVGYDQASVAHTLYVYGHRPPKRHTIYEGVRRLGVRETAQWRRGKLDLRELPPRIVPTADYGPRELEHYADTLLDAIALRSSRHGNLVYLSSGWDSTAVLACLVKLHGAGKVRAVIGRMNYAPRSGVINQFEIDRAQAVASYFGVRLDITELDWWRRGPDVVERIRPLLRSHTLSSMTVLNHAVLAQYAADNTKGEAIFAGEISDGAHNLGFSQFVTIFHPVIEFREYSDKMASYLFGPSFLRQLHEGRHTDDAVYALFRGRLGNAAFDDPSPEPAGRRRQLLSSFFLRSNRVPLWSMKNTELLTEAGKERYTSEMEATYLARAAAEVTPETLYAWYLHLYNSFHWQGSTVATLALTAGAHGLDMNLPFWDSRLIEFLSAMPESWGRGLDLKPTKYPLKWTLEHRVDYPMHLQVGPHSYTYDVDPGFSHAAEFMYGSAFAPYIRGHLARRPYQQMLSPDVFNLPYLDRIVTDYLGENEVRGTQLNDLIALALFCVVGWYGSR